MAENTPIIGAETAVDAGTPPTEREKKLKGQLSLLPQYRGEVISKNNIRSEERRVGKECRSRGARGH